MGWSCFKALQPEWIIELPSNESSPALPEDPLASIPKDTKVDQESTKCSEIFISNLDVIVTESSALMAARLPKYKCKIKF